MAMSFAWYLPVSLNDFFSKYSMNLLQHIISLSAILFLCTNFCQAQKETNKTDSLFTIWQDATQRDSVRVSALYRIIEDIKSSAPDSAWTLTEEMMLFAEAKKYLKAQADAPTRSS
jgi:hypothetical protein